MHGRSATALDRAIRRALLTADIRRYEAEYGGFTEEELGAAQAQLERSPPTGKDILNRRFCHSLQA
ncbi:hypothetical protein [Nocardia flavorosea]|uniref:Uncharacterized protein n=1 Tax=Nocardia flavorosea TaxID=53429 RepID=A0A846YLP5_9NOCA|nr:hypothetical protein [Nocardia flavorosea]NKY58530.1 hypothetical protein [Nocardia flavorosea]